MKIKLNLLPVDRGPFNCRPAYVAELDDERIHANDVILPWEFNPHNVGLFVIGHEFGPLCAVWGSEHEILDIACDLGEMDCFAIPPDDYAAMDESERDDCATLGNASEPFNLDHCWIQRVRLDESLDCRLLCGFAESRADNATTLCR